MPRIYLVQRMHRQQLMRLLLVAIPAIGAATIIVSWLQADVGVPNASAVYLVAVVLTAYVAGTVGAIATAVGSFLLYNFFFTEPLYTFTVDDPGVWLSVVLLLFVGIVVGQLAALQRSRAEVALAREREARALFQVTRELATRESTPAVMPTVAGIVRREAGMDRVWVSLGADDALERIAADTAEAEPRPSIGIYHVLQRMPGDVPARWARVHDPAGARQRQATSVQAYRVAIEAGSSVLGSIWAMRRRDRGEPGRSDKRLLAAAADQIGQALRQDRLAAESQAAEIARQSDALKSALLQSVSHDLRTPLATIRAAVGTLRPGLQLSDEDRQASADAIEREVEYLNRLVTNLLDLSRIEAGALRAERDVFELEDLVMRTLDRFRARLADRPIELVLNAPAVDVDPVFLDAAVTNAIENAIKYTSPDTPLRLAASDPATDGFVRLTIEDAGTGVPDSALPLLFDKFYRVPGRPAQSRAGTGIGLAVARGLVEAMGGRVAARRSTLGGLAIDLDLPVARLAAESATQVSR